MADMTFTEARNALEIFTKAYRGASLLAGAMDAAVSLERRSAELQNNVEHLMKEQDTQQKNLDAMQAESVTRQAQLQKAHQTTMAELTAEQAALKASIAAGKKSDAEKRANENAAYGALVESHNQDMARKLAEKAKLESEILALTKQAEDIKAKMRVFVS